jgi:hypothetical protein
MSTNQIAKNAPTVDAGTHKSAGREYRRPEIYDLGQLEKVQGGNPGNIYDGRGNTYHFFLHGPSL